MTKWVWGDEVLVRFALSADLPEVHSVLMHFAENTGLTLPKVDPAKVAQTVENVYNSGSLIVALADGKVVGALGLQRFKPWYSNSDQWGDTFFYVLPDFRGFGVAAKMVRLASEVAEWEKAPLMLAILSGNDAERKDKLYERLGLTYLGGIFGKGV